MSETQKPGDEMFIGWSPTAPAADRRFLLGAALGLVGAAAGLGAGLAGAQEPPGAGAWDQGDVRDFAGYFIAAPYPALRTTALDGTPRTAFLGTAGKLGVAGALPAALRGATGPVAVSVRASLIARGAHAMLAVSGAAQDWTVAPPGGAIPDWAAPTPVDLGPVFAVGEILDAKCWFGAMRPGHGKTHKACAALCARGGLPLAFCAQPVCGGEGEAALFLNEAGAPHGRALLPLVADKVSVTGRRVRVGDVVQLRAAATAVRRL